MMERKYKFSLIVLMVFHFVGLCGLLSSYERVFLALTPLNLILSAYLIWLNQSSVTKRWLYFLSFTFGLGFLVEYVGVRYELLFGSYYYGNALGFKVGGVPLIIGLNWTLIIYSVATSLDYTHLPIWSKILLGSCAAVFMDWLIEPVAIRYDFWYWTDGFIPFQNYVGWFITSLIMMSAYYVLKVKAKNKLALPLYLVQAGFFGLLQLAILLKGNF